MNTESICWKFQTMHFNSSFLMDLERDTVLPFSFAVVLRSKMREWVEACCDWLICSDWYIVMVLTLFSVFFCATVQLNDLLNVYYYMPIGRIMLWRCPSVCPSVRRHIGFRAITQKILQLSTSYLVYSFPLGPWRTLLILGSWPNFSRSQGSKSSNSVSGA